MPIQVPHAAEMIELEARYFDGQGSSAHTVRLRVVNGGLQILYPGALQGGNASGWEYFAVDGTMRCEEKTGSAPRILSFSNGACCEIAQGPACDALLVALNLNESLVARWQKQMQMIALSLLVLVLSLAIAWNWGVPRFAAWAAPRIPYSIEQNLTDQTLLLLEKQIGLKASALSAERQARLRVGFERLRAGVVQLAHAELLFRSADIGPNAFALPDGRVVLLDRLVEIADEPAGSSSTPSPSAETKSGQKKSGQNALGQEKRNSRPAATLPDRAADAEILGVLAHELGHVYGQHVMRSLIQSAVVTSFVAVYLSDVSSLLAGTATLLLNAAYSRDFEYEADAYGVQSLQRQGIDPRALATMLRKLESAFGSQDAHKRVFNWASSHPVTQERIDALEARAAEKQAAPEHPGQ